MTRPNSPTPRAKLIRTVWTVLNVALAGLAVFSTASDVWEAYVTLFLASALGQILWMRGKFF